jgi:Tol biopolymer transport system component
LRGPGIALAATLAALAVTAPARADVGPNGKIAYASYEDGDYDIYTMNPDGTEVINLTDAFGDWDDTDPNWSPDGTRIAFTSFRAGGGVADVFVMDADGGNQVQLTFSLGYGDFSPTWSPDGAKIAFTSSREADWEIFVMNADGSEQTNLTGPWQELAYDDLNPDWSPDGTKIVFEGVREGAWEILSVNADGTGEVNLTAEDDPPYTNINSYASFRPDGSKLVYMTQPNDGSNDWDIFVMNSDGTEKEDVVPDDEWQDVFPTWSPDGNQIIFSGNRSQFGDDLFVVDYPPPPPGIASRGRDTRVTQLTFNGTSTKPDWAPAIGADMLVEVTDAGFQPKVATIGQGDTVQWNFVGTVTHSVKDSSGMGLFSSGPVEPGEDWSFTFIGAGSYRYKDAFTPGMTGMIRVPVAATPATGDLSTRFAITWATAAPPAGYVFDVQLLRPGSTTWQDWKVDRSSLMARFTPDAGTGVYQFRARIENAAKAKASGWSPVASVTVA